MVTMEFWQVVDYLLNKAKDSIEVNAVDDTDKTALHHAARRRFWGKVDDFWFTGGGTFFLVGSFGNEKIGVIQVISVFQTPLSIGSHRKTWPFQRNFECSRI